MASKSVNLKNKPSRYNKADLAAAAARDSKKAWLVLSHYTLTVTPRFGSPITLAPGWLVCLPVDAGRLVDAGLATMAGWAYDARGKVRAVTIPGRD
jgi:hypothetical protein